MLSLQDQIERVRDKGRQVDMMGVPEANIDGHAFHTYRCTWMRQLRSTAVKWSMNQLISWLLYTAG